MRAESIENQDLVVFAIHYSQMVLSGATMNCSEMPGSERATRIACDSIKTSDDTVYLRLTEFRSQTSLFW